MSNVFNWLIKHPLIFVLPLLIIATILCVVIFVATSLPAFNDPTLGFETRGTDISMRLNTFKKLLDVTYSDNPLNEIKTNDNENFTLYDEYEDDYLSYPNETQIIYDDSINICDTLDYVPSTLIIKVKKNHLFTLKALQGMCRLERSLLSVKDCVSPQEKPSTLDKCCPIKSLPTIIAAALNLTKCDEITQSGISKLRRIFDDCFVNGSRPSLRSCEDLRDIKRCRREVMRCMKHDVFIRDVTNVVDKDSFVDGFNPTHAISHLPYIQGTYSKSLYERLKILKSSKNVEVIAANLGLQYHDFEHQLIFQLCYLIPAVFFILFIIFVYTESLFVILLNVFQLACTFVLTFFIYRMILGVHYFPFINLLSLFIIVAIGLDGTFVAFHYWSLEKSQLNIVSPNILLKRTCSKSLKSIFAASITTSAAFYSAYFFNDIPMLKAFALFSGTILLVNFIISCVFVPSMMVCSFKYGLITCFKCINKDLNSDCCYQCFKDKLLKVPCVLTKLISYFKLLFIILFLILFILSLVVIFYSPKLSVSNTMEIKLMRSPHLLQDYSALVKDKFVFPNAVLNKLPIIVVFGVKASEERSIFDMSNAGPNLYFDSNFNISSIESQIFLSDFCRKLQRFKGVQRWNMWMPKFDECYLETFKHVMRGPCPTADGSNTCCNVTHFPYAPALFEQCVKILRMTFSDMYAMGQNQIGGFRYTDDGELKAFIISMEGPAYNLSFQQELSRFYDELNDFVSNELSSAPIGCATGWFIMDDRIKLFDLQQNLYRSLPYSLLLSIATSLFITFLLTLNPLATILVCVAVASSVAQTVAIVTLLGWSLSVVESATIVVANGFMLDFILHYTIAFLDTDAKRRGVSICAPVSAAALCSMSAGMVLVFLSVHVYHQIGVFILTVTLVGWLNATFFHTSLMTLCVGWLDGCRLRWCGKKKTKTTRFDTRDSMGQKHVYRFSVADNIKVRELNNNK